MRWKYKDLKYETGGVWGRMRGKNKDLEYETGVIFKDVLVIYCKMRGRKKETHQAEEKTQRKLST